MRKRVKEKENGKGAGEQARLPLVTWERERESDKKIEMKSFRE